jgi:hypothetical protein
MAQTVTDRFWFNPRKASSCGICGRQSDTETVSPLSSSDFSSISIITQNSKLNFMLVQLLLEGQAGDGREQSKALPNIEVGGRYIGLHVFYWAQCSENLRGGQHAEDLDIDGGHRVRPHLETEREREEPPRAAVSARVLSN